jgi:hypothetical protein
VFFGGEPVYQFNLRGEIRRAYDHGLLYKAEHATLISLRRRRVPGEVQLLRNELSADESARFLREAERRLTELRAALQSGRFEVLGQVPESADVARRALDWLEGLALPPRLAVSPRAGR